MGGGQQQRPTSGSISFRDVDVAVGGGATPQLSHRAQQAVAGGGSSGGGGSGGDADTIAMLNKAVGSSIHDEEDAEMLNALDATSASSSDLDAAEERSANGDAEQQKEEAEATVAEASATNTSTLSGTGGAVNTSAASGPSQSHSSSRQGANGDVSSASRPRHSSPNRPPLTVGYRKWPRAKKLTPGGDFRGPYGNFTNEPPPAVAHLVAAQKRGAYALAEKDRRYERGLKKAHGIAATDRHRDARSALLGAAAASKAAAAQRSSSTGAHRRSAALLAASPEDPSGLGYLSQLPTAKTRSDRIVRVLIGV